LFFKKNPDAVLKNFVYIFKLENGFTFSSLNIKSPRFDNDKVIKKIRQHLQFLIHENKFFKNTTIGKVSQLKTVLVIFIVWLSKNPRDCFEMFHNFSFLI